MPVRAQHSEPPLKATWNYPVIGTLRRDCRHGDEQRLIVLFHGSGCGTVIFEHLTSYTIGNYTRDMDMSRFEVLRGSVTLSNEV